MRRLVSCTMALVMLTENAAFLHSSEGNLWKQRRDALEKAAAKQTLQSVPAVSNTASESQLYAQLAPSAAQTVVPEITAGLDQMAVSQALSSAQKTSLHGTEVPRWLKSIVGAYGNVQEIRLPAQTRPSRYVVHLLDVHEAYEGQINMAQLMEQLAASTGDKPSAPLRVGVEGASGGFDFQPYRHFASPAVVRSVSDLMVKEGLLSGAEFFGMTTQRPVRLWGVEKKDSYLENVRAFKDSLASQSDDDATLREAAAAADKLKKQFFPPDLAELDRNMTAFAQGQIGLGKYIRYLSAKADPSRMGTNLKVFLQALRLEEKLNLKQVEAERTKLIERLVESLTKGNLEQLVKTSLAYRMGRSSYREYYGYLQDVCAAHAVPIKEYPQLDTYIQYVLLAEKIQREPLLEELQAMENDVVYRSVASEAQRDLVAVSRDLRLAEKLNTFSLSNDDWMKLDGRRQTIARLPVRLEKWGSVPSDLSEKWNSLIRHHEAFYRAAQKRNQDMVDNLLAGRETDSSAVSLLVAGGFHSQGIRDLLLKKNIGYIALTPKLSQVKGLPHYLEPFSAEKTPLDKLFAGERLFLKKALRGANEPLMGTPSDALQFTGFFAASSVAETIGEMLRERLGDALQPGETVALDLDDLAKMVGPDLAAAIREEFSNFEKAADEFPAPLAGLKLTPRITLVPYADRPGLREVSLKVSLERTGAEPLVFNIAYRFESIEALSGEEKAAKLSFGTDRRTFVWSPATPSTLEEALAQLDALYDQARQWLTQKIAGFSSTAEEKANAETTFVAAAPDHRDAIIHDVAVFTAAGVVAEGHRGAVLGLTDKAEIARRKDAADGYAKRTAEAMFYARDARVFVHVAEGIGRDEVQESFVGSEVINPKGLNEQHIIVDVIEGTNATASNNGGKSRAEIGAAQSGGMMAIVSGSGIEALGNAPDVYADQLYSAVPPQYRAAVQALVEKNLEREDEAGLEEVLQAIADVNNLTINDLEFVIMQRAREGNRMAALKAIQSRFPGMTLTQIGDGTVAHGLLATLGRKPGAGKHKVMWTVGGSAEAFMNLAVAAAVPTGVGALRVYSKKVNKTAAGEEAKNLAQRYAFDEAEKKELRADRKDADAIIAGQKLFTVTDVAGTVDAEFAFITDNGVFNVPGVQEIRPGVFRVHVLRIIEGKAAIVAPLPVLRSVLQLASENQLHDGDLVVLGVADGQLTEMTT
ncbi:MAG TPA: fructose-bisphosphatase class II, partial [Elusimicrobiota bacterium]|nr:fructose-bisphosphatase class II [Elusimicrobiota bacterium]